MRANRANALKSTGPRSKDGKVTVSRNAVRHGLLSSRLFLDDENPSEFDTLQCDLQRSLNPVGAMELALVERIAVNMWRQRRLVTAETAAIHLGREPNHIASGVSQELELGYDNGFTEADLEPFDRDSIRWCKAVIDEINRLDEIDPKTFEKNAPHIFGQLKSDAEDYCDDPASYLEDFDGGVTSYVAELLTYCSKQLDEAEKRPHILALAEQVKLKRLVLPAETLALFARYQTTLDNQIYKALKALREAQAWRFKTLDGTEAMAPEDEAA